MLETGAYDMQWPDVHMQPEQTLQAHRDLKGRWLMPVHNGTFDLAMHAWHEPSTASMRWLKRAASRSLRRRWASDCR